MYVHTYAHTYKPIRGDASKSFFVSVSTSVSFEMGTQTSVVQPYTDETCNSKCVCVCVCVCVCACECVCFACNST